MNRTRILFSLILPLLGFVALTAVVLQNVRAAAEQSSPLIAVTTDGPPPADVCAAPIRIMPVGDNITRGNFSSHDAGYRLPLFLTLRDNGYNVSFVGSQQAGPTPGFDAGYEGEGKPSAWFVTEISSGVRRIDTMLNTNNPDVVLLHVGTIDVNDTSVTIETIIDNLGLIMDSVKAHNPDTTLLLAQIIDQACTKGPPGCNAKRDKTADLNVAIADFVVVRQAAGDNVIAVDMFAGAGLEYAVEPAGDFAAADTNRLHPNDAGYEKMAALWYETLVDNVLPGTCNTPPLIVNTAVTTTFANHRYFYDVLASGSPHIAYSLDEAPAGMSIDSVSGLISWIPALDQEGSHDVVVRAANSAGANTLPYTLNVGNAGVAVIQTPYQQTIFNGDDVNFSVTVTNTSAITLTKIPVFFPDAPACNKASVAGSEGLGPGASWTGDCLISNITTQLLHEVVVSGTEPVAYTATDVSTITPIAPAIEAAQTTDTPVVLVNDTAVFTITVTNSGDTPLTNVAVSNTAAADCDRADLGTLAPGASVDYTCNSDTATANFSNTAEASGAHELGTVTGDDTINVTAIDPDITVGITPDVQQILSGGDASFTVTITNTGNAQLTGIAVSNSHAAACDNGAVGTLAPGAFTSYACSQTNVTADFLNTAAVTADHTLGQVTAQDTALADVYSEDVDIVKTAVSPYLLKGDDASFTITVTNTSGTQLNNVRIDDPLASCSQAGLTLADGAAATLNCAIENVTADLTNTAFVTGTLPSGDVSSSDIFSLTVIDPGIKMTVTPDTQEIESGQKVDLTIKVENTGDVNLTNVKVTATPAAACTKTIGALAAGASTEYTCQVSPTQDMTVAFNVSGNHPLGSITDSGTAVLDVTTYFIYLPLTTRP